MKNVEQQSQDREVREEQRENKEQSGSEFEDSRKVFGRLKEKAGQLLKRGLERIGWLSASKKDQGEASEEIEALNKEIESVTEQAEAEFEDITGELEELTINKDNEDSLEEITEDDIVSSKNVPDVPDVPDVTKVEPSSKKRLQKTKAPEKSKIEEVVEINPDDIKDEGQVGPWESMPGYIRKVERSNKSETRKGVEIYERMRSNLIDRAEGDSLSEKEQSNTGQIDILNTELESYEEALDKLNKEIDLQREGDGEVDNEDIEQAERLEDEIINLEDKINILKNKEEETASLSDEDIKSTNERISAEREDIMKALRLMDRKGENYVYTLEKLNEELLEEINITKNKINIDIERTKSKLQGNIDFYEQTLKKDKLKSGLTDQQRDNYEEKKANKEEQLKKELLVVADLERKIDNLEGIMGIVEEAQEEAQEIKAKKNELSKAWKEAFKEAAKEFDLRSDETAVLAKIYREKKDEFMEEQLKKLSVGEINKIDGKKSALEFIQENVETDEAA